MTQATTPASASALRPLAGIRVLDFTAFPPGGLCTVMLADLGAEVIRVEPPAEKGRPSLVIGQVAMSRGKRSICLDLRNPASSAVLRRLAAKVDVVVENARPGSMEERGFGYSHARAANPGLIWCAITGFGQEGPYALHGGHDLSYVAHSGLLGAITAERPFHPAISIAIQFGAMSAVVAIQSALIERGKSGTGGFIDSSLSEAGTWFLTAGINPLSEKPYAIATVPDRRLYACSDGRYVAVASAEPRTWNAMCDGLGVPELKPHLHMREHDAECSEALSRQFRTRPAAEWVDALATRGAAVAMMNHGAELLRDPHAMARASFVHVGDTPVPASPVRLTAPDGRRTGTATMPPHGIGDDTGDVLSAAGFSAAEIEELAKAGVV